MMKVELILIKWIQSDDRLYERFTAWGEVTYGKALADRIQKEITDILMYGIQELGLTAAGIHANIYKVGLSNINWAEVASHFED